MHNPRDQAILDADKEGFLRSRSSLIQTIGRCARNVNGFVVMYADRVTDSMKDAIGETERRREKQMAYNKEHGITPESVIRAIKDITMEGDKRDEERKTDIRSIPKKERKRYIQELENQMDLASMNLEFEKAAELRDRIEELKELG
jgi:excinuclease ABC subunit B